MKEKSLNFTKLSIWCDSVRLHDTLFSLEGICHTGPADISLSTQRLDGTQMLERLDLKWGELHRLYPACYVCTAAISCNVHIPTQVTLFIIGRTVIEFMMSTNT